MKYLKAKTIEDDDIYLDLGHIRILGPSETGSAYGCLVQANQRYA